MKKLLFVGLLLTPMLLAGCDQNKDSETPVDYVQVKEIVNKPGEVHVLKLYAYLHEFDKAEDVGFIYTFEGDTFESLKPYFPILPDYCVEHTSDGDKKWTVKFEDTGRDLWTKDEPVISLYATRTEIR